MIGFKKLCQETVISKKANIELPSIIKLEYYKTESKLPQNKKYGIEVRKQEIEGATTMEDVVERVVELSKREAQFELWEKMRTEAKKETKRGEKTQYLLAEK